MRTSLNESRLIDEHIFSASAIEDALLFDAMLIIDANLPEKILWQRKTHAAVQQYSRKKIKAEIEAIHQKLFHNAEHISFRQRIFSVFKQ